MLMLMPSMAMVMLLPPTLPMATVPILIHRPTTTVATTTMIIHLAPTTLPTPHRLMATAAMGVASGRGLQRLSQRL